MVHGGMDVRSPQYQSLIHEARLGAMLSHPNVVGIYELGETDDGRLYVAMELIKGLSVLDLARDGLLPPAALLDVGLQACAGLHHIHSLEVDGQRVRLVHRDVKPSNLLVDANGIVKIGDLGVARLTGHDDDLIAGTPGYMPPEQMEGNEDPRSDLFALGATLYVLACGKRPFGAGAPALRRTILVEQALADPAFLAAVDERVAGLGPLLHRCFRADPNQRFSSAAELADALRAVRAQHAGPGLAASMVQGPPSLSDLSAVDLPTDVPTVERPKGRLPAAPNRFCGRAKELAEVRRLLEAHRVLVLSGPAGAGKSRLALEAARRAEAEGWPVWWVDLAEANDELHARLAAALDVPLATDDPAERLGHSLRSLGRSLLVLDGAEGVHDLCEFTPSYLVQKVFFIRVDG